MGGAKDEGAGSIRKLQFIKSKHHNRRKIVADALGMSERTLYRKIKKYGLE